MASVTDAVARARVLFEVEVEVVVHDEAVIRRCVENEDRWRETYYPLASRERVLEHLAYNFGLNGARLSQLDGWADLPDSAARGHVIDVDLVEVVDL